MSTIPPLRERGAAAVEMAIVLPLLLLILGGLVDFGRLYYTQLVLTNAAREGARTVTTGSTWSQAQTRVSQASGTLNVTPASAPPIAATASCGSGTDVVVTVSLSSPFRWTMLNVIPSLFGATISPPVLQGKASSRCV